MKSPESHTPHTTVTAAKGFSKLPSQNVGNERNLWLVDVF